MARAKAAKAEEPNEAEAEAGGDEEVLPESTIICALTGEPRKDTPEEQTIQSVIEQLLREYEVAPEDMKRDVRVAVEVEDPRSGGVKTQRKTVSLAVYEHGTEHTQDNIIRVAMVAKAGVKPASKKGGVADLEQILGNLDQDRDPVFGLWTNGGDLAFRMRTYDKRGFPVSTELTDFPAPDESLDDLESAERRPLRIASSDSLLRTFKRCHDYLYGNQSMRGDRAFWQLLYLIFAKILDEKQSQRRVFFVGATEGNTEEGRNRVAARIRSLFKRAQTEEYKDVFDQSERIDLNDRALTYIAGELGRYSLLSTDTDAKGMAYEAITSTTLKRERGQFFTPRNVIRMMVEMLDPEAGKLVLDPACGSGGFLVVALAHVRRRLLAESGCDYPDQPLPSELKRVESPMKKYAEKCLFGIDVDPELLKAARMNMVMNNDGRGNLACFNSLEYGVKGRESDAMRAFEKRGGGHGKFDFVLTNPPFGAKIPVDDPEVLAKFDLGQRWIRSGDTWTPGDLQKKVPPEILFIEACCKFLKPGTGVMAIVLPNGILGNPGEQMEAVRWWMLEQMELLASVDLPVETFLPQVWVGASCVFLRRRADDERRMRGPDGLKRRPVFMATAENCGHGRRGETRYVRRPDGSEDLFEATIVERWEKGKRIDTRVRKRMVKRVADDMPWIAAQYRKHAAGEPFEGA